jgi:hypothetical protein
MIIEISMAEFLKSGRPDRFGGWVIGAYLGLGCWDFGKDSRSTINRRSSESHPWEGV